MIRIASRRAIEPDLIMGQAIGVIETSGMPAALVTADLLGKAANVRVIGLENTNAGRISVLIQGYTGDVQAAIAAVVKTLKRHPGIILLGHHVIPCPDGQVNLRQWHLGDRQTALPDSVEWLDD